jgi:hypothetical protein
MKLVAFILLAILLATLCLAPRNAAGASLGSVCEHTHQCTQGLWCLAESPTSTSGHCERISILYP